MVQCLFLTRTTDYDSIKMMLLDKKRYNKFILCLLQFLANVLKRACALDDEMVWYLIDVTMIVWE